MADLKNIAAAFGIEVSTFEQAQNAILSQVYIAGGPYILRSRTLSEETVPKLEREAALIDAVRPLTKLQFPRLMPAADGKLCVVAEDLVWTAYPVIEGEILCNWWEQEKLERNAREILYRTLKKLHTGTAGRLADIPRHQDFLTDVRAWLTAIPAGTLSEQQRARVTQAADIVERFEKTLSEEDLCFIHRDYHPGNILYEGNTIIGLIDTDLSRKGSHIEDLSFTLMMLMRDYRQPQFIFDQQVFDDALRWYGFPESEMPVLREYMLLSVFYEVYLFSTKPEVRSMTHLVPFQLSFLEDLIARW